ncbi:MAG: hypothetical protein FJ390_05875 [Verrucomicrobia bacterium]|nr:hypothetical protein [Verrucomicrobiota bacterium]
MKFILSLLFAFLSSCFAQEISSSIIVEDYVAFLSSTPGADQYYNGATMQDQIQRLEKGDEIIYCPVKGQEKEAMLRLTDLDVACYWRWEENSHETISPLMYLPSQSSSEQSSRNHSDSQSEKEEQAQLRAKTDSTINPSSQQPRDLFFTGLRESHSSNRNPLLSPASTFSSSSSAAQPSRPAGVPSANEIRTIELTAIRQQALEAKNSDHNERTPLLDHPQALPTYGEQMDRTSSAQEEIAPQGYFSRMPSNSELACLVFACTQPALLAYTGGIIHGPTVAAFAKGYAITALAEYGAIGVSIVTPIAGGHLYDSLNPRIASCAEAASRYFLTGQNCLTRFLSSETLPLTLLQAIEQDKQAAWTVQDNIKHEALESLQRKLHLKAQSEGKTPDSFSDDDVIAIIRGHIAHQQTVITHSNQQGLEAQTTETKLKIAALQEYLPQEESE